MVRPGEALAAYGLAMRWCGMAVCGFGKGCFYAAKFPRRANGVVCKGWAG
jgi:hypothetical protein